MKIYNEIELFKQQCKFVDLCDDYAARWNSVKSEEELIQLATNAQAMPYVLTALVKKNRAITPEFLLKNFKRYINEDNIIQQDGYDSQLFVRRELSYDIVATINGLYECTGSIYIKRNQVCVLYTVNCDLDIINSGNLTHYNWDNKKKEFIIIKH